MSTSDYLKSEYDSAAFEAINPGADAINFNPFYQTMSSAFAEYLQQKFGFKGIVQCVGHSTLAEAKQWLQLRAGEIARINLKYIATDWAYNANLPSAVATPAANPPKAEPPTTQPQVNSGIATTIYGVCVAIHSTTRYYSAAFSSLIAESPAYYDLVQRTSGIWRHSFVEYVLKKYGNGFPQCTAFKSMAEA